ncbi:MAG TPA: antitoxin Xre/MbcA/ParS toxin-binding domain-containing protein [Croceibacterium sp.]|nr:antitoxin Xre/MbcA/ParS toxin-binding domain-containing protein [Croceibacterium sp.]
MRFRKSHAPRLAPDSARRQGEITRLAFHVLGRDAAISFLNSDHAELGARPLDLAVASAAGCASVEAALGRIAFREPKDS